MTPPFPWIAPRDPAFAPVVLDRPQPRHGGHVLPNHVDELLELHAIPRMRHVRLIELTSRCRWFFFPQPHRPHQNRAPKLVKSARVSQKKIQIWTPCLTIWPSLPFTSFCAAGLMGRWWLWERKTSRQREEPAR